MITPMNTVASLALKAPPELPDLAKTQGAEKSAYREADKTFA